MREMEPAKKMGKILNICMNHAWTSKGHVILFSWFIQRPRYVVQAQLATAPLLPPGCLQSTSWAETPKWLHGYELWNQTNTLKAASTRSHGLTTYNIQHPPGMLSSLPPSLTHGPGDVHNNHKVSLYGYSFSRSILHGKVQLPTGSKASQIYSMRIDAYCSFSCLRARQWSLWLPTLTDCTVR